MVRATVPFPAPDGPSMAMIRWRGGTFSTLHGETAGTVETIFYTANSTDMSRFSWRTPTLIALVTLTAAVWLSLPYARAAALVIDLSGISTPIRRLLPVRVRTVTWRDVAV